MESDILNSTQSSTELQANFSDTTTSSSELEKIDFGQPNLGWLLSNVNLTDGIDFKVKKLSRAWKKKQETYLNQNTKVT